MEAQIGESSVADRQMDNEQHHHRGMAEDGVHLQVGEALREASLQSQSLEQRLKDDQPGERGELLVLEADFRQRAGFPMDFGKAVFLFQTVTSPFLQLSRSVQFEESLPRLDARVEEYRRAGGRVIYDVVRSITAEGDEAAITSRAGGGFTVNIENGSVQL